MVNIYISVSAEVGVYVHEVPIFDELLLLCDYLAAQEFSHEHDLQRFNCRTAPSAGPV